MLAWEGSPGRGTSVGQSRGAGNEGPEGEEQVVGRGFVKGCSGK